jgi:ubiquinone/menaquinone biosynthesis C-methylase UbiE
MSFDWLAPHYRWMEWVTAGGKLQRCRTAYLADVPPPREVLILGEGNGRFLEALLTLHPDARCVCVDASMRMLATAEARVRAHWQKAGRGSGGVEFVHADALAWHPPAGRFDWIVTHFFLDCFQPEQLRELVPRFAGAAAPEASWLLADFFEPVGGFAKWRARAILRLMYFFFRATTHLPAHGLTSPDGYLQTRGFQLRSRRVYDWGLLHSDWWQRRQEAVVS